MCHCLFSPQPLALPFANHVAAVAVAVVVAAAVVHRNSSARPREVVISIQVPPAGTRDPNEISFNASVNAAFEHAKRLGHAPPRIAGSLCQRMPLAARLRSHPLLGWSPSNSLNGWRNLSHVSAFSRSGCLQAKETWNPTTHPTSTALFGGGASRTRFLNWPRCAALHCIRHVHRWWLEAQETHVETIPYLLPPLRKL
jgi:hypothetical protein